MLKNANLLLVYIFIFVASVAPYVSARGAALAFAQNPEETKVSDQSFPKEVFRTEITSFFMNTIVQVILFPFYIALKPQKFLVEILRPPLILPNFL